MLLGRCAGALKSTPGCPDVPRMFPSAASLKSYLNPPEFSWDSSNYSLSSDQNHLETLVSYTLFLGLVRDLYINFAYITKGVCLVGGMGLQTWTLN